MFWEENWPDNATSQPSCFLSKTIARPLKSVNSRWGTGVAKGTRLTRCGGCCEGPSWRLFLDFWKRETNQFQIQVHVIHRPYSYRALMLHTVAWLLFVDGKGRIWMKVVYYSCMEQPRAGPNVSSPFIWNAWRDRYEYVRVYGRNLKYTANVVTFFDYLKEFNQSTYQVLYGMGKKGRALIGYVFDTRSVYSVHENWRDLWKLN